MKLYFLGICGTAMGNAALLARALGHEVEGGDSGVYPPMSTVLAEGGVAIHPGYDPARLARLQPDLVIIGNAHSRGNPEIEWLLAERRIPFTSLPAFLHEFVLRRRRNLVIAGTHGKTTTTSLTAFLLREAGRDPGFLIGGVPLDPPVGAHVGAAADPFVIEGDEYDSAFFDKRSKFIHYAPHIAVLNNLEFDHADIFRDLVDVQRTFTHLVRLVPSNGFLVVNGDDPNLRQLSSVAWTTVVRVGLEPGCDVRLADFAESARGSYFKLWWKDRPWAEVTWSLPGMFNARNATMAAVAAALAVNPDQPTAFGLDALGRFRGVRRRQEVLFKSEAISVIEDFGHHPTALAETLASFRMRHPHALLTAVFEPRSNTARTKVLQSGFMRALTSADAVFLGAVNRAEKLSAEARFDPEAVVQHLELQGVEAHTAAGNDGLLEKLVSHARSGAGRPRVVIFFTNGNFDGIIPRFVEAIKGLRLA